MRVKRGSNGFGLAFLLAITASGAFAEDAPDIACPKSPTEYGKYRDELLKQATEGGDDSADDIAESILGCFPKKGPHIPGCLTGLAHAVLPPDAMEPSKAKLAETLKLPAIFYDAQGNYEIPANIDELAKQNHWLTTEFKTRGQGGFAPASSNLKIIEILGKQMNPPQKTDWFIQWSLIEDASDPVSDPVPANRKPLPHGRFAAIAMVHNPDDTTTPIYYTMYAGQKRRYGGLQGTADGIGPAGPDGDANACLQCHQDGLREISPRGYYPIENEKQLPEDRQRLVDDINNMIRLEGVSIDHNKHPMLHKLDHGYRVSSLGNELYDPTEHGPNYGVEYFDPSLKERLMGPPTRTEDFILGPKGKDGKPNGKGCAYSRPSYEFKGELKRTENDRTFKLSAHPNINPAKVARAMDCNRCHDGLRRTTINNVNVDESTLVSKILVDGSMPLYGVDPNSFFHHSGLNADEKIALISCLRAEKPVQYGPWLKIQAAASGDCPGDVPNKNCATCGSAGLNGSGKAGVDDGTAAKLWEELKQIF